VHAVGEEVGAVRVWGRRGSTEAELRVASAVIGGNGPHADAGGVGEAVGVGFARISAKSENTSTGITLRPAPLRFVKSVVL
jgi:hypothetical protein